MLNAEPDDLGSALRKHMVEGKNWLPHTVLTFAHARDKILGSVDLPWEKEADTWMEKEMGVSLMCVLLILEAQPILCK